MRKDVKSLLVSSLVALCVWTLCYALGYKLGLPDFGEVEIANQEMVEEVRRPSGILKLEVGNGVLQVDSWERRWVRISGEAPCPENTRRRARLLVELACVEPEMALDIAYKESNWLIREELRNAALGGWASVDPDAAIDWALEQSVMGERMRCVSAVIGGAVVDAEAAIRICLEACEADPIPAGDYGHALINAMSERMGDFDTATRFALNAVSIDRQSYLVDSAYYQWARHEPDRAFESLVSLKSHPEYRSLLKGVIEGAADADARQLAQYASRLPEGDERSEMLAVALTKWVGKDPDEALEWIGNSDPHPDYDRGLASLALQPSLVAEDPEAALELTDFICDSSRRLLAKSNVFTQWARKDFEAAEQYVSTIQNPEYQEMYMIDLSTVAMGREQ